MAELVKGLTRWIVVPLCIGSNPIFRPIFERLNLYGFIIKRLGNSFENPSFFVFITLICFIL